MWAKLGKTLLCGHQGRLLDFGHNDATIGDGCVLDYIVRMSEISDKISFEALTGPAEEQSTDADYLAWKEAKIRKGLEQAKDRSLMIPAEEVWKRFGFER